MKIENKFNENGKSIQEIMEEMVVIYYYDTIKA